MRRFLLAALILILVSLLSGEVVINELCFNPEGADGGKEWLELYNNGSNTVNLQGARIEAGGSEFDLIAVLPNFLLRPGRYVLIGGVEVSNAVIVINLTMQNGGGQTDGVRYRSASGTYTDTVLYDSPNINALSDDNGITGTSFAVNPPEGFALARRLDGVDTNDSAADFMVTAFPSPGLPNPIVVDYSLGTASISEDSDYWSMDFYLRNSSIIKPIQNAILNYYVDEQFHHSEDIEPINPGDSIACNAVFYIPGQENHTVEAELLYSADPDTTNNYLRLYITQSELSVQFNELMYHPNTGEQEWLELRFVSVPLTRNQMSIKDSAGNFTRFLAPLNAGYYVICSDKDEMLARYPDCPESSIIECSTWASLNNDGDSLSLYEQDEEEPIAVYSYSGDSQHQGISLERIEEATLEQWRYSLSPNGASPGMRNSEQGGEIPDTEGKVTILGSPFRASQGEKLQIVYKLDEPENRINCRIYDQSGRLRKTLAYNLLTGANGQLLWDGKNDAGSMLPAGLYFILWESRSGSNSRIYRKQKTAVLGL